MELVNKRIVITGGTSGIGYQLVKQLHRNNKLVVVARSKLKLHALHQEFSNIFPLEADLANLADVENIGKQIKSEFPKIDLLINNAAVQHTAYFTDQDFYYKGIAKEVNTNFTSICCLISLLLPCLKHQENAVILNVNSGLAFAPKTSSAVYCATKSALKSFSTSLAYQLTGSNVSVQQVFLPLVETQMTKGREGKKLQAEDVAQRIIKGIKSNKSHHHIGKVKLLNLLMSISPQLAQQVMKNA